MKPSPVSLLLVSLLFCHCSKIAPDSPYNGETDIDIALSSMNFTKSLIASNNSVSQVDVQYYLEREALEKDSSHAEYSIIPYLGSCGDTLMYIVNFNGHGWKLLSGDRRTPPILAEGEDGVFVLDEGNPGLMGWIESTANRIATIKQSPDSEIAFSKEQRRINSSFWRKKTNPTRMNPDTTLLVMGYWRVDTSYCFEPYYEREHLTPHWTQNERYNSCSPLLLNSTERAPAGCIAVAMANELYYLHKIYNVPTSMFSNCAVSGNIISYTRYFSDPSPSSWALMDTTYHSSSTTLAPEAVLIGFLGQLVGIVYGADGSWALPSNIVTAFSNFGINCTLSSYSDAIAKESLNNNIPVIAIASDYLIPLNFRMHCFVIDGYQKTRLKTTYYYQWVAPPHAGPIPLPDEENYSTVTYSDRGITAFKINWGWGNQWGSPAVNDGWYALTDDWIVSNGNNEYDYNHNRMVVHDFSITN